MSQHENIVMSSNVAKAMELSAKPRSALLFVLLGVATLSLIASFSLLIAAVTIH